jgi:hypothetical protein
MLYLGNIANAAEDASDMELKSNCDRILAM